MAPVKPFPVASRLVEERVEKRNMELHDQRVIAAQSKVDSSAPAYMHHLDYNAKKAMADAERQREIELDNARLCEKLLAIDSMDSSQVIKPTTCRSTLVNTPGMYHADVGGAQCVDHINMNAGSCPRSLHYRGASPIRGDAYDSDTQGRTSTRTSLAGNVGLVRGPSYTSLQSAAEQPQGSRGPSPVRGSWNGQLVRRTPSYSIERGLLGSSTLGASMDLTPEASADSSSFLPPIRRSTPPRPSRTSEIGSPNPLAAAALINSAANSPARPPIPTGRHLRQGSDMNSPTRSSLPERFHNSSSPLRGSHPPPAPTHSTAIPAVDQRLTQSAEAPLSSAPPKPPSRAPSPGRSLHPGFNTPGVPARLTSPGRGAISPHPLCEPPASRLSSSGSIHQYSPAPPQGGLAPAPPAGRTPSRGPSPVRPGRLSRGPSPLRGSCRLDSGALSDTGSEMGYSVVDGRNESELKQSRLRNVYLPGGPSIPPDPRGNIVTAVRRSMAGSARNSSSGGAHSLPGPKQGGPALPSHHDADDIFEEASADAVPLATGLHQQRVEAASMAMQGVSVGRERVSSAGGAAHRYSAVTDSIEGF